MKFASIDIGSNAMRLLICRVVDEAKKGTELKKIEFIRIPLRLGDDVFIRGKLSNEKKELFIMAMQAFKLIIDIHKVQIYRACATSAMRDASNGLATTRAVYRKTKLKIDVISGEEESRLIMQSVMQNIPGKGNFMNIDVGGGSTEITIISNGIILDSKSFDIGTVRLLDKAVDSEIWLEMKQWVESKTKKHKGIKAIGTGGNINKLYRMSAYAVKNEYMPYAELEMLYDKISRLTFQERINQLRFNPDRADVIEQAAIIYLKVLSWANCNEIISPQAGLKEGIIMQLWQEWKNSGVSNQ
jgi:exopolyphosphatase/guanosine-5'-triphosphate,3'-diphosphate pyrophosphatase